MQEKLIHSDLCWHCPVSYDSIGNRLTSSDNFGTATYAANCLNLYTAVNPTIDQLVLRSLNEGVSEQLVLRSFSEGGSNNLTYDADGNLLLDDRFTYSYDDENRLVSVTPLSPYPFNAVVNAYDHRNRRIRKDVWGYHEGDWRYQETHTFVWDGWNVVLEQISYEDQILHTIEYFWGNDVSGSEQGAGGVGGLLATRIDGVFYVPVYGSNGNIMIYVGENGSIAAQYDYDPYGNILQASGPLAQQFAFGFSTKYMDVETGLISYLRRFYRPDHGRWLNRDPIEELARKGINVAMYGDWEDPADVNSQSYIAGEVTEVVVEIAVTAGGTTLRHVAKKTVRAGVEGGARQAFRRAKGIGKGGVVHHVNPIKGHYNGKKARFPLPFEWAAQGEWNMVWYATKAEHIAAHQRLMQLEALDKLRTMTMFSRQGANAIMQHLNSSSETKCWDSIDIDIMLNHEEQGFDTSTIGIGASAWFEEYGRSE